MANTYDAAHDDHHDQPDAGIKRWLFATNHKDIGTMYLVFSLIMFFVGGAMAMVIRAELFQPGLQLLDPVLFNQMTTNHALVMIFGAVMPAFVGLANWMIPLQIGAPDSFKKGADSQTAELRQVGDNAPATDARAPVESVKTAQVVH